MDSKQNEATAIRIGTTPAGQTFDEGIQFTGTCSDGYPIKTTPVQGVEGVTRFTAAATKSGEDVEARANSMEQIWFSGQWEDCGEDLPTEEIQYLRIFLSKLTKK